MMSNNSIHIRPCSESDMANILDWLKAEDARDVPGCFWCNRSIIERAAEQGDVVVASMEGASRCPIENRPAN